ncbi:MAG: C1 family peptidase [Alphaproteobacteria bacterium]
MKKRFCLILLFLLPALIAADGIDRINQAIAERGAAWTAGDNPAWQRTLAGEGPCLSCTQPPFLFPLGEWEIPPLRRDLPAHFDWRDVEGANWVTPIKDQGLCAGCSAFGAVAALETQVMWDRQDADLGLDLSEQHLFSCSGGDCQSGMVMGLAMIYLKQNGVPDEDCFPYQSGAAGENFPCADTCADWEERAYRIESWNWVYHLGDFDRIKTAIMEGPLYCYIAVYEDFFAYTGGVYEHTWGGGGGGHGVALIGWDDAEQYWIGKNSWTDGWGEEGFFRIRWGEAEIETYMGRLVWEPDVTDDDTIDDDTADDDTADDDTADDDTNDFPDDDTIHDDDLDDDTFYPDTPAEHSEQGCGC